MAVERLNWSCPWADLLICAKSTKIGQPGREGQLYDPRLDTAPPRIAQPLHTGRQLSSGACFCLSYTPAIYSYPGYL